VITEECWPGDKEPRANTFERDFETEEREPGTSEHERGTEEL
jgi:hypothetical protein